MTTRCPSSGPQDPVSRVFNIRGQGPSTASLNVAGQPLAFDDSAFGKILVNKAIAQGRSERAGSAP
ncbi:hypothetical protein B9S64_02470 [Streptomyces sp. SM18]|nr:hypothetical protein B9S64_02470 [Streptomyces sp. SM18]